MSNSWRRGAKVVALLGSVLVLTTLTQVGGVALLVTAWIVRLRRWSAWRSVPSFVAIYGLAVLVVVPPLAKLGGRERLPCLVGKGDAYGAASPLLCVLNRNYARPEVHTTVAALADHMAKTFPGTVTRYLDAGFPFFDGFPLPPHLSHRDGLKIDLAYFYHERSGAIIADGTASPIGYWAYEEPGGGEPQPCAGYRRANLRWDFEVLQPLATRRADPARSAEMLRWLTTEGRALGVKKILLEPHLKARWAPDVDMIRFQGCRAARHDDHLHLELSKKN